MQKEVNESVQMFKVLFIASLFVTLMVNIMFLFATKDKPPDLAGRDGVELMRAGHWINNQSNSVRDYESKKVQVSADTGQSNDDNNQHDTSCDSGQNQNLLTTIKLRVKSSKNHVFVSANDLIIYESKSAASLKENRSSYRLNDASVNVSEHSYGEISEIIAGEPSTDPLDLDTNGSGDRRGIHVIVLNEFNGIIMAKRVFDTYSFGQDDELSAFVRTIRDGRILVFAIKDEGSFRMANDSSARRLLKRLGSRHVMHLGWRDMWAFVVRKSQLTHRMELRLRGKQVVEAQQVARNQVNLGEVLTKSSRLNDWAPAIVMDVELPLACKSASGSPGERCKWSSGRRPEDGRRRAFCSKLEGFAHVCDCQRPAKIEFEQTTKVSNWQLDQVPIIVMASNRAYYLYRMLSSLLAADGLNSSMVTVFIDGFYEDPLRVSQLFNLRAVQQAPLSRRSARISHHYRSSLTATFDRLFPRAEFAIIFEEDLDVARDTLVYFNQTIGLLKRDPSLYCSSAWNDQGYRQSTGNDLGLLYRIETMPGLGWMLSKRLYKEELEPNWPAPDQPHDWDMWIRTEAIRKRRECIIPDISRTYHFGSIGTNINSYFQHQYFSEHAFANGSHKEGPTKFRDLDKLSQEAYERHMEQLIGEAQCIVQVNYEQTSRDFLCSLGQPNLADMNGGNSTSSVIFIEMIDEYDHSNWLKLAKCWRIWDLDARGQHRSMWRLFLLGRPVFVVGYPASPYGRFKPAHVKPFKL